MQPVLLPPNLGRLEAQQELMSKSQNCSRGSRKCGGGRYLRIRMMKRLLPSAHVPPTQNLRVDPCHSAPTLVIDASVEPSLQFAAQMSALGRKRTWAGHGLGMFIEGRTDARFWPKADTLPGGGFREASV